MNTELDLRGRRSDGSEFTMDVGLIPLEAHRGNLVIVSVRDLSEQKRVERRERDSLARAGIVELGSAAPGDPGIHGARREAEMPGSICSILLLDESGKRLMHGAAPTSAGVLQCGSGRIRDRRWCRFLRDGCFPGKAVVVEGCPGGLSLGQLSASRRDGQDPGVLSQPVFSAGKKVLGTFAIYHREPRVPEPKDVENDRSRRQLREPSPLPANAARRRSSPSASRPRPPCGRAKSASGKSWKISRRSLDARCAGRTAALHQPRYEKIWAAPAPRFMNRRMRGLKRSTPTDRERVPHRSTLHAGTDQYDEEYRIIRPDGSVRWIHDRAFPIRDGSGKSIGCGVARTSPSAARSRNACANRRRWKPSANWPEAWRTISTISSRR